MSLHAWVVIFRYGADEPWEWYRGARGGLDAILYDKKHSAQLDAFQKRRMVGRGNVKVISVEVKP